MLPITQKGSESIKIQLKAKQEGKSPAKVFLQIFNDQLINKGYIEDCICTSKDKGSMRTAFKVGQCFIQVIDSHGLLLKYLGQVNFNTLPVNDTIALNMKGDSNFFVCMESPRLFSLSTRLDQSHLMHLNNTSFLSKFHIDFLRIVLSESNDEFFVHCEGKTKDKLEVFYQLLQKTQMREFVSFNGMQLKVANMDDKQLLSFMTYLMSFQASYSSLFLNYSIVFCS